MKKFKNIKLTSTIILLSSAVLGLGGGGLAFFLTQNKKSEHTVHREKISSKYIDKLGFSVDYYDDKEAEYTYVLDQSHVDSFIEKIKQFTFYGPEASAIKSVSINNKDIISNSENGIYINASGEIGLNTASIEANLFALNKDSEDLNSFKNIYVSQLPNYLGSIYKPVIQDIIVEELLETFFHEYGHHIFSTYVLSPYPEENNYTQNLYSKQNSTLNQGNKTFIDSFINSFNYKSETKHINAKRIKVFDDDYFDPISKDFSLKDLYTHANTNNDSDLSFPSFELLFSINNKDLKINPINKGKKVKFLSQKIPFISTSSELDYYYSIDELLTRKFQLSSYPSNQIEMDIINGVTISDLVNSTDKFDYKIATDLVQNLLMYDSPYTVNNDLKLNGNYESSFYENGRSSGYYTDDPFINKSNTVAKEFVENIAKATGSMNGYDITYMHHKNTFKSISQTIIESYSDIGDLDMIKIGGYLDATVPYKYLGYKDESDQLIKIDDIYIDSDNIGLSYKDKLFSDKENITSVKSKNKQYWSTINYTNVKKYSGKELYFYNNSTDLRKITSFRGEKSKDDHTNKIEGYTSTWMRNDPYNNDINTNIWGLKKNDGKLTIEKIGSHSTVKYKEIDE